MQKIVLGAHYDPALIPAGPIVLAEGFFDGVHRGHQAVIKRARQLADEKKAKLAVMTFDVHPSVVFQDIAPDQVRYLTSLPQKLVHLANLDVDLVYVLHFDAELGALPPQAFVDQFMVALHAVAVVAGFDYTYGPAKIANMATLTKYAKKRFIVEEVPQLSLDGQKISSTRIRAALDAGQVDLANELLGYTYETSGLVVHGEARGRTLGFPTANVEHSQNTRVPGIGIYAVMVKAGANWYQGMASIGRNVTFGAGRPITVEIYLLKFSGDLYGQTLVVRWEHRLRGEVKFNDAEALVTQLQQDELDTAGYFQTNPAQDLN